MKLNIRKFGASAAAVMIAALLCACSNEKTSEPLSDVSDDTSTSTTTTASQTTSATSTTTEHTEHITTTESKPEESTEKPVSVYSDEEIENVVDVNIEMIAERDLEMLREHKTFNAFTAFAALATTYGINFNEGYLKENHVTLYNLWQTYGVEPLEGGYWLPEIMIAYSTFSQLGYIMNGYDTRFTIEEIYAMLNNGNASMLWLTEELIEAEPEYRYSTKNNIKTAYYESPEAVVLVGYSDTGVKVWSPLKEDYVVYDREIFEQRFEELGAMAVMLKKAE